MSSCRYHMVFMQTKRHVFFAKSIEFICVYLGTKQCSQQKLILHTSYCMPHIISHPVRELYRRSEKDFLILSDDVEAANLLSPEERDDVGTALARPYIVSFFISLLSE